jgi:hypothetical protein
VSVGRTATDDAANFTDRNPFDLADVVQALAEQNHTNGFENQAHDED